MPNKLHSLPDILEEILAEYYIKGFDDAEEKERVRINLRKKIESICKGITIGKTDLWERSKQSDSTRARHYFSEKEYQRIRESPELHDYMRVTASSQDGYEEIQKMKQQARNESKEYMEALRDGYCGPDDDYKDVFVTDEDVTKKKLSLMIEALYCIFFDPINEKELRQDMELDAQRQDEDVSYLCVHARNHLQEGISYYCKRKHRRKRRRRSKRKD